MTVGERMREVRKKAGLTQAQLAEKSGVATISIHQYETGKREPRLEQLLNIASALNVDINWLMNGQTLEQRERGWKDFVAQRFREARASQILYDKEKILEAIDIMSQTTSGLSSEFGNEPGYKALVQIDEALAKLNSEGQQEAVKRVEELTEIPRYQAQQPPQPSPAPQEGKDTTPAPDAPETPPEGE